MSLVALVDDALTRDAIRWGRTELAYDIAYSARRKTLAIEVYPDLRIRVTAPLGAKPERIRALVHKRARWIRAQQRAFALYLPQQPPRRYVNGESHRYLGRQYRLRAEQGGENRVRCLRGYFLITTRSMPTPERVQRQLENWYRDHAERIFHERLDACHPRAAREGIARPALRIKRMHKRWGSCSADGQITLNLELIKAPKECIDYVIMHELCHLKEPHHGPRFWALLGRLMPGFEQERERLNRLLAQ